MAAPLTPDGFRQATGVSRETIARLEAYADLLRLWQPRINLVGPATMEDLWRRHFLDSAQLVPYLPEEGSGGRAVDLGSGAGFPGLVLALMSSQFHVTLIEADHRKAVFLREVIRVTEAPAKVVAARAEAVAADHSRAPGLITARALAPLPDLLSLAQPFADAETVCLFHKGAQWQEELTEARQRWIVDIEALPSVTHPEARILRICGLIAPVEPGV